VISWSKALIDVSMKESKSLPDFVTKMTICFNIIDVNVYNMPCNADNVTTVRCQYYWVLVTNNIRIYFNRIHRKMLLKLQNNITLAFSAKVVTYLHNTILVICSDLQFTLTTSLFVNVLSVQQSLNRNLALVWSYLSCLSELLGVFPVILPCILFY